MAGSKAGRDGEQSPHLSLLSVRLAVIRARRSPSTGWPSPKFLRHISV